MLTSQDLEFFAVVAAAPSLAGAARALDVTPPAVTQRLKSLEQRLGVRLIDRSSRRLHLTPEGTALAARSAAILEEMKVLAASLAARRGEIAGPLRVVAPLGFGRAHVAPVMARMRQDHPAVELDLILSEDPAGRIRSDGWDVLVQVGPLADSALALRHLAPNRRILCAAPSYLAARGIPRSPGELDRHACGVIREDRADVTLWGFTHLGGETVTIRMRPDFASNDGEVIKTWAVAGLGIVQRSEWDVADDISAGRLVEIMPDWRLPDADVVALLGPRAGRTARLERFVDMLHRSLTPVPWRRNGR
ncbi:LysR family transcriptional regulator [Aliidongia dinghuensis]|uniref:LysR family transcriptional regulator n=1 Tax=Aliidongia dinghuensis TaxID=1867774 RepID=A0A8J2YVQ1_9PROT|nr:LysR substrate-binding domain-containing protein [Aliidongia dinghuensis]GGF24632.1 LysR family transcriptional regulator [Aliidongia dinghuensis]